MFKRKKKDKKKKNLYPAEQAYLQEWDAKPVQQGQPPASREAWQPSPDQWPQEQAKPVSKSVWQPPPEDWPTQAAAPVPQSQEDRPPPVNPEYEPPKNEEVPPPPPYEEAMRQQQSLYPQLHTVNTPQPYVQQAAPAYTPYQQPSSAIQMTIAHPVQQQPIVHQAPQVQPQPQTPAVAYPPPPPNNSMYGRN